MQWCTTDAGGMGLGYCRQVIRSLRDGRQLGMRRMWEAERPRRRGTSPDVGSTGGCRAGLTRSLVFLATCQYASPVPPDVKIRRDRHWSNPGYRRRSRLNVVTQLIVVVGRQVARA